MARRPSSSLSSALTIGGYRAAALAARAMPGVVSRALVRADPSLHGVRLRRAVQQSFDSYARYWLESFRLPYLDADVVDANMHVDGYQFVLDGLARGRGVILALPHLGGWEWAGRWLVDRGHGLTVVVERLDPPELFQWFADLRAKLGMQVIELGPDAGRSVSAALRRNDVVCLLCDRDIQRTGVEVEFFGERTTLPPGPAMLGIRSGAPVLPTAVYFGGGTHEHRGLVRPPIAFERSGDGLRADVAAGTQALAHELEYLIRRAPQQWHLMQPNWPSDPGYGPLPESEPAADLHPVNA